MTPLRIASLVLLTLLSSCGGGGGGGGSSSSIGYFIDSPVQGLTYSSSTYSGTTGADGAFNYAAGSGTVFKVGNVTVGTVDSIPTDGKVTPYDLVGVSRTDTNNSKAIAIAQFLQSISNDTGGNLSIPASVVKILSAIAPINLITNGSPMVQADLANLVSIATSGTKTLVSPTTAANALASYMLLAGIDTKKGLKSITNLSISPSSMSIAIGLSHQLTVSSVFSDGTSQTVDNTQIQFVSSNINVVTVSKTGIINAMGPGSAEVSITYGGVSIKATVTVPQGVVPGGFSGQVFT